MSRLVSAWRNRAERQCPRALRAVEVLRQTADGTATLGAWSMGSGSLLMHKACEGTLQARSQSARPNSDYTRYSGLQWEKSKTDADSPSTRC